MKGVLWRVAKRLSYKQDARYLKVKHILYQFQTPNRKSSLSRLVRKLNVGFMHVTMHSFVFYEAFTSTSATCLLVAFAKLQERL